jgi:hypothetical protein
MIIQRDFMILAGMVTQVFDFFELWLGRIRNLRGHTRL